MKFEEAMAVTREGKTARLVVGSDGRTITIEDGKAYRNGVRIMSLWLGEIMSEDWEIVASGPESAQG